MNTPNFPHKYLFKEVGPRTAAKKAREGTCKHWGCTRPARNNAKDCNTCKSRKADIRNPARRAFRMVKDSARKRGIPFNLSFDEFKEFDRQTGYVESRGQSAECLSIDRINPEKGYEVGNIRAMNWLENCRRRCDGMTDPAEPIARAICKASGGDVWQKFRPIANSTLGLVECLQAQLEGGFQPPLDEDEEDIPF